MLIVTSNGKSVFNMDRILRIYISDDARWIMIQTSQDSSIGIAKYSDKNQAESVLREIVAYYNMGKKVYNIPKGDEEDE